MSGLARATGRLARLARPAAAALALPPLGLPQSQGTVMCRRFAGYVDPGPPRAPPPGDVGAPSYIAPRPTPSTAPGGGFSPTGQVQIGQPPAGSAPPAAAAQDAPPLKRVTAEDLNSEALKEMGIGGLDKELQDLFRRAFASRLVPPGVAERMGMGHVKGILMHGPPGTGKTLIARKIGRVLSGGREPQARASLPALPHGPHSDILHCVVNGPELLARYVGQSEANMRALFDAAENEYKREGDNASLHVIIFDEIDALCKARGRDSDGPAVGDSMVNQLLTKLDGVSSVPNVLVIGLTNRRDLLDEALLRPGRLEVQMEIGLPDAGGREQILRIHTRTMAENDMLAADVDLGAVAAASRNFSGAEIAGLVRAAASHAYHRILNPGGHDAPETHGRHGRGLGMGKVEVRQADFEVALSEITPALGASGAVQGLNAFKRWYPHGMVWTGPQFDSIVAACRGLVAKVKGGQNSAPMVTALLEGPPGTGKTALAATIAAESEFPFARVVCAADNMVGMSDRERSAVLKKAFDDALASPLSCLVLDNLERILGFSRVGPVYSNEVLQTLLLLLRRPPAPGRRLLVVATTSSADVMQALEVSAAFNVTLHVKPIERAADKASVLQAVAGMSAEDAAQAAKLLPSPVPIKTLLQMLEMASAAENFSAMISGDGQPQPTAEAAAPSTHVSVAGMKAYLSSLGALSPPEPEQRGAGELANKVPGGFPVPAN
eukprot:jgi/Tetstr1/422946/TSEL_013725.t1